MFMSMILSALLYGCTADVYTTSIDTGFDETVSGVDDYFTPVAFSISYTGGWDEHQDALLEWSYDGEGYDGYIRLTLVSEKFFSLSPDDEVGLETESCEVRALFHAEPASLDAVHRDDGSPATLRAAFVGGLEIYGFIGPECYNLNPEIWADGEPREALDGMRLGLGFGEMTDFLRASWADSTLLTYGSYMLAEYVAVNTPDGTGGVDFIAKDWTTAMLWQWDVESGEVLTDGSDLMGQDISDPVLSGWLTGYPIWFQPLDTLDLALLQEGAADAGAE